ncbi:hypothetical protein P20495_1846 [Pseudoalteromonas sp. BSi20495]|nr:hypothetical protein P20495_1846 [Pseudoalteromonas sp. BSi20495]
MGEAHKDINAISLQLHINQKLRFSREQALRLQHIKTSSPNCRRTACWRDGRSP